MLKVFLTEDERLVREGLRDMIPWEQYGFVFAGEASDGEMALPLVRKIKPDVLITDIKMPFMDGLAFSRLVSKELPATKIIILSGYDDFAYAQQAIELHVDQYLLKPITRTSMIQALEQTKARIEEERDQQDYRRRFIRESQEYEHYARRVFFEKLVGGRLRVPEIYEQANRLELELDAEAYNIVLFTLQPKENITAYSEQSAALQDNLLQDFLQYPDFLVFRGSALSYAVLLKGSRGQMETMTKRCVELIEQRCAGGEALVDWYAAIGEPTERLSSLPRCYAAANHALAFRHLMPNTHILKTEMTGSRGKLSAYSAADQGRLDPTLIQGFIQNGLETEIEDFTNEFFDGLGIACDSLLIRHYLLLSTRINALAAAEKLGLERDQEVHPLMDLVVVGKKQLYSVGHLIPRAGQSLAVRVGLDRISNRLAKQFGVALQQGDSKRPEVAIFEAAGAVHLGDYLPDLLDFFLAKVLQPCVELRLAAFFDPKDELITR